MHFTENMKLSKLEKINQTIKMFRCTHSRFLTSAVFWSPNLSLCFYYPATDRSSQLSHSLLPVNIVYKQHNYNAVSCIKNEQSRSIPNTIDRDKSELITTSDVYGFPVTHPLRSDNRVSVRQRVIHVYRLVRQSATANYCVQ